MAQRGEGVCLSDLMVSAPEPRLLLQYSFGFSYNPVSETGHPGFESYLCQLLTVTIGKILHLRVPPCVLVCRVKEQ